MLDLESRGDGRRLGIVDPFRQRAAPTDDLEFVELVLEPPSGRCRAVANLVQRDASSHQRFFHRVHKRTPVLGRHASRH